jgi:hypothetical protein
MNRAHFLGNPQVRAFLTYLPPRLLAWHVDYLSAYHRILPADRPFNAVGVHAALTQYVWPAQFRAPAAMTIGGVSYAPGVQVPTYRWPETFDALTQLGTGLRAAIVPGAAPSALSWCKAILEWGLGPAFLHAAQSALIVHGKCLEAYLRAIQAHCTLGLVDTAYLAPPLVHMNSGLAKVHSLASIDGLAIFDSRVAFALGKLINEYCNTHHVYPIPDPLRIYRTVGRTPPPVLSSTKGRPDNHHLFPTRRFLAGAFGTNVGWMDAQIRVSWIIEEVLTADPHLFPGLPISQRCHQLEAALFMMGAQ